MKKYISIQVTIQVTIQVSIQVTIQVTPHTPCLHHARLNIFVKPLPYMLVTFVT